MASELKETLERICNELEERSEALNELGSEITSWNNDCHLTEAIRHINAAIAELNGIDLEDEN